MRVSIYIFVISYYETHIRTLLLNIFLITVAVYLFSEMKKAEQQEEWSRSVW